MEYTGYIIIIELRTYRTFHIIKVPPVLIYTRMNSGNNAQIFL